MARKGENRRVAIGCQGGGSHTAFTAGVLKRILKERGIDFEIVALSGTSGGAICALLVWYGLLTGDKDMAVELLDSFWSDNSANSFWDLLLNNTLLCSSRLRSFLPVPELSPYSYPDWAQGQLKRTLEKHVKFEKIKELVNKSSPMLFVGSVNVLSGDFRVFKNTEISADAILASAAIPTLFRAVQIDKEVFWDGLFSQNPPIHELTKAKPDEIWVIQINPPTRKNEPKSIEDIRDRRNELSGNLSLEQEIYFIEKINELVKTIPPLGSKYKHIKMRRVIMLRDLDYSSKLDRSPSFIEDMIAYGERQAEDFLEKMQRSHV